MARWKGRALRCALAAPTAHAPPPAAQGAHLLGGPGGGPALGIRRGGASRERGAAQAPLSFPRALGSSHAPHTQPEPS